jgi:predicted permease
MALAVAVVAAASVLTRSLARLQAVDMGLSADRLVFVELALPRAKSVDRTRHLQFLNDVVAQLEATPHVAAATPVNVAPFSGVGGWELPLFTAEGQSADRAATNPSLNLESIHPNYFETFGVTLVRGRPFTRADRQDAPNVAIVSEDVAARVWRGEDPIGKRIKFGGLEWNDPWRTIVGVARPTRYRELAEKRATLYLPAEQFLVAAQMLVLRTASPLPLVAGLAREGVRAVDPDVQVMRVAPFSELLAEPLARPRFNAFVLGVFGVAALLLAAVGLYAVMAAYVRQRYPEIGIRVALGATASDVRRLVLGEGLRLAGLGVALGVASAVVANRLLRGLLFDVDPLDPVSIVAAMLLLVGVSALASYVPARRAVDLDPIATLRAH